MLPSFATKNQEAVALWAGWAFQVWGLSVQGLGLGALRRIG